MEKEILHIEPLKCSDLRISPVEIARSMGYINVDECPLMQEGEQLLQEMCHFRGIAASVSIMPIVHSIENNSITIENRKFEVGPTISGKLRGANVVGLFVCTAGDQICDFVTRLHITGDLSQAYVADLIGTIVVEKVANILHHRYLGRYCHERGLKMTNRYSPGNCEWPLAGQEALFDVLPASFTNVNLTAGNMMNPVKSLSGIIGIGSDVKYEMDDCKICTQENCNFRTIRNFQLQDYKNSDFKP